MKKQYETPQLHVHGDVETLTQRSATGTFADRLIFGNPAGTPLIGQDLADAQALGALS